MRIGAPAGVLARGWGWRHAGRRHDAVSLLDIDIRPGERVLLLGASGSGKSTLLAALAGVLGDAEDGDETGELLLDGRRPSDVRGRVGLVLQDPDGQIVLARVRDEVGFACENLGVPAAEIPGRVDAALEAVGLQHVVDVATSALSGGQKQRLALAGVLAMRPGVLLLDEPTANLDPDGVQEVRDAVLRSVADTGATLVVVEHRVAVWSDAVDRVIVLGAGGGVLADGDPARVLADAAGDLAAAGVWLPGRAPVAPPRRSVVPVEPLLRADGLVVGRTPFGSRLALPATEGLDATALSGRTLAVVGPNGAGKSTFALTAAGLLPPVAGELRALPPLARGLGAAPHRWRSRELLSRIGTVFQAPEHQFLTSGVRRELAVGPRALRRPADEVARTVDELLVRLRLEHLAEANPFTLSGGEKRRLSVATAIATAPALLVLDEPTFGQDARTWAELLLLLAQLRDGGAGIIAVTHDEHVVSALADEVLALEAPRPAAVLA